MSSIANLGNEWKDLTISLDQEILDTLSILGFTHMTPVQQATIPLLAKHKDVFVEAVTGSGKTLAFAIPVMEKLLQRESELVGHEIGAVVITPTRELAQQIYTVFDQFTCGHSRKDQLTLGLYIGGSTSLSEDIASFKQQRPRILIGTPGRLQDLLIRSSKLVNTKELEMLVLDEADRLLDLGFAQQLNSIIAQLPKQRRTGLFSATMTDGLSDLIRAGMRNPTRVIVKVEDLENGDTQRTPATLEIDYVVCGTEQKLLQMIRRMEAELASLDGARKFIVYFATCSCVDYFHKVLKQISRLDPFSVHSLHGQMDAKRRVAAYNAYTSLAPSVPSVLLCTDVASRGLDIPDVDYVIQVDPPQDPKTFTHRCGRAARAGRKGKATLFLTNGREEVYVDFLQRRKIPLQCGSYILSDGTYQATESSAEAESTPAIEDPSVAPFIQSLRDIVKADRDLHDRSMKAFTSWVRSYSKHETNFIFRLKDVDLGRAATGFGLLRLPRMPELKSLEQVQFEEQDIDWATFKYLDKNREAARQRALAEAPKKAAAKMDEPRPKKAVAWSNKVEAKARKLDRKLKKDRKREYLKRKKTEDEELARKKAQDDVDDWQELANDTRMLKKVKKGKISRDEFDKAMFAEDDLE